MQYGPTNTIEALRACLAANVPVKLESLPGAGKTSLLNALFGASDGYLHTMVAVTHDPTDFGGIPIPDIAGGQYKLLPGEWAVDLAKATKEHPVVGLFLDEINTAGRAVLAACLKVVDERRVGYFALPQEVRIMLAMNPAEANGGVDLTPAMANRVSHIPFEFPVAEWTKGLTDGFKSPDPLTLPDQDAITDASKPHGQAFARFLMANNNWVEVYPTESLLRSKAWPSRRTWTMATRLLGACDVMGYGPDTRSLCLNSLVGEQAANAFHDWQDRLTIDIDPFFDDPDGVDLPDADDNLFAILMQIGDEVRERDTQDAVDASIKVLSRVYDSRPGIAASSIQAIARWLIDNPHLAQSNTVRQALVKFGPVIQSIGS